MYFRLRNRSCVLIICLPSNYLTHFHGIAHSLILSYKPFVIHSSDNRIPLIKLQNFTHQTTEFHSSDYRISLTRQQKERRLRNLTNHAPQCRLYRLLLRFIHVCTIFALALRQTTLSCRIFIGKAIEFH